MHAHDARGGGGSSHLVDAGVRPMISTELLFYIALGFAAQLVDGALGMAYGLIATSVLLASGAPPALSSASVHAAEVVTTGLAGASHVWHQNVDWRTFRRLAVARCAWRHYRGLYPD